MYFSRSRFSKELYYSAAGSSANYGTDIDSEEHLIACKHSVKEISDMIGADSLGYLPAENLAELTGSSDICSACFTGAYPTEVPVDTRKDRFEQKLSEK